MHEDLYNLHLLAGKKCGEEKTHKGKRSFSDEESALKASVSHNNWDKRYHDVEPYPCFYCEGWHIGRIMPEEELKKIIAA